MLSTQKLATDFGRPVAGEPISLATLYSKLRRRSYAFDVLVCGFAPLVDDGGWFAAGRQQDIAARIRLGRNTVQASIETLVRFGIIERVKLRKRGVHPPLYRINPAYLAAVLQARDLLAPRREDRP